jgi:hypothetical protein
MSASIDAADVKYTYTGSASSRDIEQGGAEVVHHHRGYRGRHTGEGDLDMRRVELDEARDNVLGAVRFGGELHGGEVVEADVEAGLRFPGGEVGNFGHEIGGHGHLRNEHGERHGAEAAAEQTLGGVENGREVSGDAEWDEHNS